MKKTTRNSRTIFTDEEYIRGLKAGDEKVTYSFFYTLCGYTLNDILWSLMGGRVEYDDLVNELYIYLSDNGWHRLDTFSGKNDCSLKTWMVRLAWRFFLRRKGYLVNDLPQDEYAVLDTEVNESLKVEIAMDVESTFSRMNCKRYVQILQWMLVEGRDADEVAAMLETSVANVYNIKHRAVKKFIETYNM